MMHDLTPKEIMGLILAIAAVVMLFGCATEPAVKPNICEMNPTDQTCWVDKAIDDGMKFKDMNGWFCMDQDDMVKVIAHTQECKSFLP